LTVRPSQELKEAPSAGVDIAAAAIPVNRAGLRDDDAGGDICALIYFHAMTAFYYSRNGAAPSQAEAAWSLIAPGTRITRILALPF
jgi:hypothetical protein